MTDGVVKVSGSNALRRYAFLAYGTLGTMLDVGLMVVGSLFIGLGVAVLLIGFGIVDVRQGLSTAAMLVSAMVLGVAGLFCLGIAAEGPLGRGRRLVGFELWEIGIGRVVAAFIVGLAALLLYDFLAGLTEEMPRPLVRATLGVRAVGVTGMTVMPLLGVPLSLALRFASTYRAWLGRGDIPVMFVVWAVSVLIVIA